MSEIKKYKPTSPGRRNSSVIDYKKVITNTKPEKSLTVKKVNKAGRNSEGKITERHKDGIYGKVASIEYDPNRTSFIALINYIDGEKRYIIAPENIKVGDKVISGKDVEITIGNSLPLENIPEGTFVHNIELKPGKGAELVRSAGSSAQVLGKDETERYVIVRLASGEMRKILAKNRATIGTVSNSGHNLERIGKAGRNRHKGIRPTVRGSVMNPNDHPHGGGEGKSPIGRKAPMIPCGKKELGVKTRKKDKQSNKYIIRTRKGKK